MLLVTHLLAGNELMRQDQYSAAVEAYTRAIQIDGSNAVYYCNRSDTFWWIIIIRWAAHFFTASSSVTFVHSFTWYQNIIEY